MGISSGASRLAGRVCARTSIKRLTLLAFALAMFGAPDAAEAKAYRWKNVDGNWNVAANWDPIDGGTTFPNAPGDEAHFTLLYSDNRTVTIPNGVTVTVGKIFYSSTAIHIGGPGTLRIDNGFQVAQIIRVNSAPLSDAIAAPLVLRSSPEIIIADAAAGIVISGNISNSLCACGLTMKSAGRLTLRGNNSYLGTTSVESGRLILDFFDDVTKINGNLEIGSGQAGVNVVAEVLVSKRNQISDTSTVLIKSQGLLTVDAPEAVGETTIIDGFITMRNAGTVFAPSKLTMTGGAIESRTDASLRLDGELTATSSARGAARVFRAAGSGVFDLGPVGDRFTINDGPSTAHDLTIDLPIVGTGFAGLAQFGTGTLRMTGANTYKGLTAVQSGRLWLEPPAGGSSVLGGLTIGSFGPAIVEVRKPNAIADNESVFIGPNASLWINTTTPEVINRLAVRYGGTVLVGNFTAGARLVTSELALEGSTIQMFFDENTLEVTSSLKAMSTDGPKAAVISGGNLVLGGARTIELQNGPEAIDLRISSKILGGAADGMKFTGGGIAALSGINPYGGPTTISGVTVLINGQQPASPITLMNGGLGGNGTIGPVTVSPAANNATVTPGQSPGNLKTGSLALTSGTSFDVELDGKNPDASDRLTVKGTVNLANAKLFILTTPTASADARWTLIDNDGVDPVVGTFFERPEGYQEEIDGRLFRISYRGGDGNDVVLEPLTPLTYYLAEGATGEFFDDDVLIANPNNEEAPATLTFLREGGASVVVQRVIPARSRVTIHVDEIEGLENASASVEVKTPAHLPLIVERSMFWDASYYGGHTANAVEKPEKQWTFAEGFQGFFDTYILIANANDRQTTATLTFLTEPSPSAPSSELAAQSSTARAMPLRENDTPVVKTVDVAPFQRKTIYAGDYDELKGRAFGIVVDATEPVIAERAMYFASQPNRTWAGGHVNTGVVAPSRTWFHAEGATGSFFSTFILLSNPQDTTANVNVRFLLADGTVIARPKTLEPKQRLTINPATENDPRLENAALSTVVESDVPIVSERSMYWEGDAKPLGEGHNSSGVVETGLRWGLSEGRVGGDRHFVTYILLANPTTTAARVRVSYLRENGAPIVKEYDVPATSRFNIDVKTDVPELENSSFGADIEVLNDVPIAVERSLYWDAVGAFWSGGTNALATRLRPAA
jgi:autotransporter-associated beta strand protein